MFSPTSAIKGLADSTKQDRNFGPRRLLGPHRRGLKHLKRHKMFEMVEYDTSLLLVPIMIGGA